MLECTGSETDPTAGLVNHNSGKMTCCLLAPFSGQYRFEPERGAVSFCVLLRYPDVRAHLGIIAVESQDFRICKDAGRWLDHCFLVRRLPSTRFRCSADIHCVLSGHKTRLRSDPARFSHCNLLAAKRNSPGRISAHACNPVVAVSADGAARAFADSVTGRHTSGYGLRLVPQQQR